MKIIKLYYDYDLYDLYVGNEFSPDPLDMQQKIQEAFKNHSTKDDSRHELVVDSGYEADKDIEKITKVTTYIKNLLTKNGYVVYNPHTVIIK